MIYESHITVENLSRSNFLLICDQINVKPVIIESDTGSLLPIQMMTSKFHKADRSTAMDEMFSISSKFSNVIRRKLEIVVPFKKITSECLYEEYHSKFIDSDGLEIEIKKLGGISSRNSMHKDFVFVTSRELSKHTYMVSKLKESFKYVGTISERVVFDDNPGVDNIACFNCPLKVYDILEM